MNCGMERSTSRIGSLVWFHKSDSVGLFVGIDNMHSVVSDPWFVFPFPNKTLITD